MKKCSKQFSITSILSKDAITHNDDNELIIRGIANTGQADLVDDVVTREALQSICDQIPNHNLHLDHDKSVEGVLGPLLSGEVTDKGLEYTARIIQEKASLIKSLLEQGVNFGSSISGVCDYQENSDTFIVDWILTEISLTLIPCDQGTMGTTSLSKSFDETVIKVKQEKNNMTNDNISKEEVVDLINVAITESEGKVEEKIGEVTETIKGIEETVNELKAIVEQLNQGGNNSTSSDDDPGDDSQGKDYTEALQKMVDELGTKLQKHIDDNMLETFCKSYNMQKDKTGDGLQFKYHKPADKDQDKNLTSKDVADLILGGL